MSGTLFFHSYSINYTDINYIGENIIHDDKNGINYRKNKNDDYLCPFTKPFPYEQIGDKPRITELTNSSIEGKDYLVILLLLVIMI